LPTFALPCRFAPSLRPSFAVFGLPRLHHTAHCAPPPHPCAFVTSTARSCLHGRVYFEHCLPVSCRSTVRRFVFTVCTATTPHRLSTLFAAPNTRLLPLWFCVYALLTRAASLPRAALDLTWRSFGLPRRFAGSVPPHVSWLPLPLPRAAPGHKVAAAPGHMLPRFVRVRARAPPHASLRSLHPGGAALARARQPPVLRFTFI